VGTRVPSPHPLRSARRCPSIQSTMSDEAVHATLRALEAELFAAELRVTKLRRAVAALREVLEPEGASVGPAPAQPSPEPSPEPSAAPFRADGQVIVSGTATMDRRSRLEPAAIDYLRDRGTEGTTLEAMSMDLWNRKILGGESGPSIESLRQVLLRLARKGIAVSTTPPGQKKALWRLRNQLLPAAHVQEPDEFNMAHLELRP
jgi:hypothetical protein